MDEGVKTHDHWALSTLIGPRKCATPQSELAVVLL